MRRVALVMLLLVFAGALAFAQNQTAQENRTDYGAPVPYKTPYENVSNYSYPYLIPPPPGVIPPPRPPNWLEWWQQFDGAPEPPESNETDGGGGGKPPEPKVYVVWMASPENPLIYWKDKTYDVYNGWNWSTSGNGSYSTWHGNGSVDYQVVRVLNSGNYTIQMIKPATSGSFIHEASFYHSKPLNYSIEPDSYGDSLLTVTSAGDNTTIAYNVTYYNLEGFEEDGAGGWNDLPEEVVELNTRLPKSFPEEMYEVSSYLRDENLSYIQQVKKNLVWTHEWIEYDLYWNANQTIPEGTDMAYYVYLKKKGFCAHYATLFATVSRAQGIPVRLSAGFAGGYPSGNASYIFPIYAHAWNEVYVPNYGWVPMDPTGNMTEIQEEIANQTESNETQEVKIEWSDAGQAKVDLQFTLNDTLQQELQEYFEEEIREEMEQNQTDFSNMTEEEQEQMIQEMAEERMQEFFEYLNQTSNLDELEKYGWNYSDINWSEGDYNHSLDWDYNQSSGLNQTGLNQTGEPQDANYTQEEWNQMWEYYNSTGNHSFDYNYTYNYSNMNWTQEYNQSLEEEKEWDYEWEKEWAENGTKLDEEDEVLNLTGYGEEENENEQVHDSVSDIAGGLEGQGSGLLEFASGLASSPEFFWWALGASLLIVVALGALVLVQARVRRSLAEQEADKAVELFRKVNIKRVIREYKELGKKREYKKAIVFAYNELADFIAYVSRVFNDPSKTAREFAQAIAGRVDVRSLEEITRLFEKVLYAGDASKNDYEEFLEALEKLAGEEK